MKNRTCHTCVNSSDWESKGILFCHKHNVGMETESTCEQWEIYLNASQDDTIERLQEENDNLRRNRDALRDEVCAHLVTIKDLEHLKDLTTRQEKLIETYQDRILNLASDNDSLERRNQNQADRLKAIGAAYHAT